jgi:hypothetical protein
MPAATTHVEFAKDVYNLLSSSEKGKITNRQMFYLGSQGPDLFFFSRASVLPGSLKHYGNQMHDEKVWEVIRSFDNYAGDDPDLRSYICGYLCHYALDCRVHPLVCALAKYRHQTTGIHEGESHVSIEAEIDVWMLHQRGRDIQDYDVYKSLRQKGADVRKLTGMLCVMLKEVFDAEVSPSAVSQSIREIALWTHFLAPKKPTLLFLQKFEDMIHIPHSISGMMLLGKDDPAIINLSHHSYPSRTDDSVMISDSFPELYGKAALTAEKLIRHFDASDFALNFLGEPDPAYTAPAV